MKLTQTSFNSGCRSAVLALTVAGVAACAAPEDAEDEALDETAQGVEVVETYRASTDFSSTQGYRGWFYLSGTGAQLPTYNASNHWQGNETYLLVYSTGQHPGGAADSVRKWVAPRPGRARITGSVYDTSTTCGDGVSATITMGGIYATAMWSRTLNNGTTTPQTFDLTVDVVKGTELFFVLNKRGNNDCDWTAFDPQIALTYENDTSGTVFSAASDFTTPLGKALQGYHGWTYESGTGEALQWDTATSRWRKAPWIGGDPALLLWTPGRAHPGVAASAVRKWTSWFAGDVTITGTISDDDLSCGNGTNMQIVRTSREGSEVIWQRATTEIATLGNAFTVKTGVTPGATLKFVVDPQGTNACDTSTFNPTITRTTTGNTYIAELPRLLSITPPSGNKFEVPPFIWPGSWRGYQVTTAWTDTCATPYNPLAQGIYGYGDPQTTCTRTMNPADDKAWGRINYGAYSQFVINGKLVAINHGENKNVCASGMCKSNTVDAQVGCGQPGVPNACTSGLDVWQAYSGFVGLSWQTSDLAHNWGMSPHNDVGPISWPANGYTSGGIAAYAGTSWWKKSSQGLKHPRGFVGSDGYFYVYYLDMGEVAGDPIYGFQNKVARAPIAGDAFLNPSQWQAWCGPSCWTAAMPAGFDKNNIGAFYATRGGASRALFADGGSTSFAIAQTTTGGYLGVSEKLLGGGQWELRIYSATDLNAQNWTLVSTLRSKDRDWESGDFHYPAFLSAHAWSSTLVNPSAFYLVGTSSDMNTLRVLPVSLNGKGGTASFSLSGTASATVAVRMQDIWLNAGEQLTAGVCTTTAQYTGDTYLRLYGPTGAQVAFNDDACGSGSQLTVTAATSGFHRLYMGCYSSGACTGTAIWTVP